MRDQNNQERVCGDYFSEDMMDKPIVVKEAWALSSALQAFKGDLSNSRVDVGIDNQGVIAAWERQGSRSADLNKVMKHIFDICQMHNLDLSLSYIASQENPADLPSRLIRKADTRLSLRAWLVVDQVCGGTKGHTVDLMALDSNAMPNRSGQPLPHFTPYPTPESKGVDMFSQSIGSEEVCYVSPPIATYHQSWPLWINSTSCVQ